MSSFLRYTFGKWFGNKETKIIMFGLSCSGKTTIVSKLCLGDFCETEKILNLQKIETIKYEKLTMHIITVGDCSYNHRICRQIFPNADGLIFVIDSSSQWNINDARESLFSLIKENDLKNSKLLIYSNKCDIKGVLDAKELEKVLELNKVTQEWKIQDCCAITGDGLLEGINWLCGRIVNQAKSTK